MNYLDVPSAGRFQKDSSVTFAIRGEDRILTHIDWLLECYEETAWSNDPVKRRVILCDLFLTCNFWIKSYHERNPRMRKERYPVVLALFEAVVDKLGILLMCNRAQVAQALDEIYGRELHKHGIQVDDFQKRAQYFSKLERQIYRLRFKGGLAYQYQWWVSNPGKTQVPADSRHAYTLISRRAEGGGQATGSEDFGGFIMTMERELYMAKHWVGGRGSQKGTFHSSYTAGERVIMAGNMLIEGGVIRTIRSDSGHYQPTEMNMAALLQALGMYGVDLHTIDLMDFKGDPIGKADDFLHARVSWDQYLVQRANERAHRVESDNVRLGQGGQVRFPHLQPQTSSGPVGTGGGEYVRV